jgi:biotin carboxylase
LREEWIAFMPAGTWQKKSILMAQDLGYKVIAIDSDPSAEGLLVSDDSVLLADLDCFSLVSTLKSKDLQIIAALSIASDVGVIPCSQIREAFQLPGMHPQVAELFTYKHLQRERWLMGGIPGPKWRKLARDDDYSSELMSLEFPLIVKPSDSSGSRGVTKVESLESLDSALDEAFNFSRLGIAIVEEFMPGTEFTVEVFCSNFKCHIIMITQKIKVPGTDDTVARELFNPILESELELKISETVKRAFNSLNYRDGPGHAEIILKEDGTVGMVEVAARGGGFLIFDEMIPRSSGIDISRLTIESELRKDVKVPKRKNNKSILRFIESRKGVVQSIYIPLESDLPIGLLIRPLVNVGQTLRDPISDGDRMCAILATSQDLKGAQELVSWAIENIEIIVK